MCVCVEDAHTYVQQGRSGNNEGGIPERKMLPGQKGETSRRNTDTMTDDRGERERMKERVREPQTHTTDRQTTMLSKDEEMKKSESRRETDRQTDGQKDKHINTTMVSVQHE